MYSADARVYGRLKCDEADDEPSTVSTERVLKIECNISSTTNYMHTGVMDVRLTTISRCAHVLTSDDNLVHESKG